MEQILERRPWLTPVVLALLSVIFFGGVLRTPGEVLAGQDIGALFIPWLDFAVDSVRGGSLPLWNPNQFAGYPFFANIQVALSYPPSWLYLIFTIPAGMVVNLMLHVWLGGWGMARLVRWAGGARAGALTAGIVFAFSGFMAARVEAGHVGLIATLAWTPWVALAYWWAARGDGWRRAALAGVPWALAILAGHITSMLYVGLALASAAAYQAAAVARGPVWRRLWRAGRPLAVMVTVGLALSAVQLLPTAEFAPYSTRVGGGYDEATRFSMPVAHLITVAVPDFYGQPSVTGYWGPGNYTEFTYYVGVLPLLLALLALRVPGFRRPTIFFASLAAGGLLLALGPNGALYPVISRLLPVFRLARAPARGGFLFVFGASALAGLAVTALADSSARRRLTHPLTPWLVGLVGGGAALAAVIALLLFALNPPGAEAGRLFHMGNALFQFAVWLLLASALLIAWRRSRAGATRWALPVVMGLALLDLWTFGGRLVRTASPPPAAMWATVHDLTAAAYREEGPFRVLPWGISIFEQNGATLTADIESVFGYNAMGLQALDAFVSPVPEVTARAYDLLNARYVVVNGPLETEPADPNAPVYVGEGNGVYVYARPTWMPRAWLAGRYEVTDEPVTRLNQPDFDYRTTVLLDAPPPCEPAGAAGNVTIVEETPNRVTLQVEAEEPTLLVYSGTFYPGWSAEVDGAPTGVLRADSMLRAVCVPAGSRTVTMRFRPASLVVGGIITLAALGLVMAGVFGYYLRKR